MREVAGPSEGLREPPRGPVWPQTGLPERLFGRQGCKLLAVDASGAPGLKWRDRCADQKDICPISKHSQALGQN